MKKTLILTAGAFGDAVADRFAHLCPADRLSLLSPQDELDRAIAAAGFVAVAVWRPYVPECLAVDAMCHRHGVRWSLAETAGQRLCVGPLVHPGAGPCYQCYRKRFGVHHPAPERDLVLDGAYRNDPSLGIPGFLGPMVEIAARGLQADAAAGAAQAGRLRMIDTLTGSVLETAILAVHGCRTCRPAPEGPAGARFVKELIPAVERILG